MLTLLNKPARIQFDRIFTDVSLMGTFPFIIFLWEDSRGSNKDLQYSILTPNYMIVGDMNAKTK